MNRSRKRSFQEHTAVDSRHMLDPYQTRLRRPLHRNRYRGRRRFRGSVRRNPYTSSMSASPSCIGYFHHNSDHQAFPAAHTTQAERCRYCHRNCYRRRRILQHQVQPAPRMSNPSPQNTSMCPCCTATSAYHCPCKFHLAADTSSTSRMYSSFQATSNSRFVLLVEHPTIGLRRFDHRNRCQRRRKSRFAAKPHLGK